VNGGNYWDVIRFNYYSYDALRAVYFVNSNIGYAVGDHGLILKTTNGGGGFSQQIGTSNNLNSVYFINENIGFAVGTGTLLKTTDGGNSWVNHSISNNWIFFSVYFTNDSTGFILANNATIFKTTDAGNNWISQPNGTNYNLFSMHFPDPMIGYCVGDFGTVIKTTDGGIEWFDVSTSSLNRLNSVYFTDVIIGYVVGNYSTILKTTNGGITFIEEEPNPTQPNSFLLSQNYPNPFNPVTKIKYSVPQNVRRETGNVSLKIYDVLGREIATLVNEEKPAGEYEVEFNGSVLPSGIYFYQLKAGDPSTSSGQVYTETRKMVLLK